MARVRQFFALRSSASPHPTEVDCGWCVLTTEEGTFLQLSTYGADTRQSKPKVSQTLQFDEAHAAELIGLLRRAFPGIR